MTQNVLAIGLVARRQRAGRRLVQIVVLVGLLCAQSITSALLARMIGAAAVLPPEPRADTG